MTSAFSFLPHWPLDPGILFWTGAALFAASLCGELCWRIWRFPRITGYGVIGLIAGTVGFSSLGAIGGALAAGEARILINIAMGLLLFELGSRVSFRWIRTNPWLIATSLAEAMLTFTFVALVLCAMHFSPMTATVAASIAIATSPAMVIQLKNELKSDGQVTERMLILTALNSMYAVLLLKLISVWPHQAYYGNMLATIAEPCYLIIGSLVLAYGLARSCNFLSRRFNMQDKHSFVMLIGLVLVAFALARALELSTILTLLVAGILFKNFDERPQLWPTHFGTAGWFLTVILFVITPISFQWKFIASGGIAALALISVRLITKLTGVLAFAKPSGISIKQGIALGFALTPMSALAYLLLDDIYWLYPNFDPALRAMTQCSIVVLQLLTPLLVYWSLSFCGERRQ